MRQMRLIHNCNNSWCLVLAILVLSSGASGFLVDSLLSSITTQTQGQLGLLARSPPKNAYPRIARRRWQQATGKSLAATSPSASSPLDNTVPPSRHSSSFVRWHKTLPADRQDDKRERRWEMQTAVKTFRRRRSKPANPTSDHVNDDADENVIEEVVDLHAQLHFGEPSYFQEYNSGTMAEKYDTVLYELLVDESLLDASLSTDSFHPIRRIKPGVAIGASPSDQGVASQYGWTCQADSIDYTRATWIHADMTRQEFVQRSQKRREAAGEALNKEPLWKLSQSRFLRLPAPAAEAATALLVGPPLSNADVNGVVRRRPKRNGLFRRQTFSTVISVLRSMLWMTVPSPEISIMLLDWSDVFVKTDSTDTGLSQVFLDAVTLLASGKFLRARQLIFGQVVVNNSPTAGQSDGDDDDLLVTQRNERAMEVLEDTLQSASLKAMRSREKVALLYGCNHCSDLQERLVGAGFEPVSTEWRTAWSVSICSVNDSTFRASSSSLPDSLSFPSARLDDDLSPQSLASSLASSLNAILSSLPTSTRIAVVSAFVLYFGIGALDWISTWDSILVDAEAAMRDNFGDHADYGGVLLDAILYLVRHVFLYVGLSKFVLDWNPKE